jgi:hypothetical protein
LLKNNIDKKGYSEKDRPVLNKHIFASRKFSKKMYSVAYFNCLFNGAAR